MSEKIGDRISVNLVYDHFTNTAIPKHIRWKQKVYTITKMGLHYPIHQGRTLIHMFSVTDDHHCFLLSFNTESLSWRLEEISED